MRRLVRNAVITTLIRRRCQHQPRSGLLQVVSFNVISLIRFHLAMLETPWDGAGGGVRTATIALAAVSQCLRMRSDSGFRSVFAARRVKRHPSAVRQLYERLRESPLMRLVSSCLSRQDVGLKPTQGCRPSRAAFARFCGCCCEMRRAREDRETISSVHSYKESH